MSQHRFAPRNLPQIAIKSDERKITEKHSENREKEKKAGRRRMTAGLRLPLV